MRTLIAALAFVSTMAHAQEWVARLPNRAGGMIVFLSYKGNCQQGNAVYGSIPNGNTTWGCWIASDNHVMVFWNDGSTPSAFSYENIELNPKLNSTPRKPAPGSF